MDLDLIGRALIGLGAALACIGAFFMLRSRAPGTQPEMDGDEVNHEPRMPGRHDNRDPAYQSTGE
jgi:hypothetical protein